MSAGRGGDPLRRRTPHQHPTTRECEVLVGLGMRTWADSPGRTPNCWALPSLRAPKKFRCQEGVRWVDKLRRQAETPLLLAVDGTLVGLISCATSAWRQQVLI